MQDYPIQMRFRTDGYHNITDQQPGDVWRIHWYKQDGQGPVAGYAICCPGCGKIHHWTTANNCKTKGQKDPAYPYMCTHSGVGSCWDWTGSAEGNTLTGRPSLQVTADDCHWHGYLTNGKLHL